MSLGIGKLVTSKLGGALLGGAAGMDGFTSPPQTKYMWEVSFTDPFQQAGDNISVYASATAIPTKTIEQAKRYFAGVEYTYGIRDNSPRTFRATFWDSQTMAIYRFFENWMQLVSTYDLGFQPTPKIYKRDMELALRDVSGFQATDKFKFTDAYPVEMSEVDLSYAESGVITFDVMFSFSQRDMDYD